MADTEHKTYNPAMGAATVTAQIIGFNNVKYFQDLPTGFRVNWKDAMEAGAFDNAKTIGDFVKAYCGFVSAMCDR